MYMCSFIPIPYKMSCIIIAPALLRDIMDADLPCVLYSSVPSELKGYIVGVTARPFQTTGYGLRHAKD